MSAATRYADGVDALRRDFIPRSDYEGVDVAQLEIDRLWPRVWLMACREEELVHAGDYVTFEIANESFLIVRARDGGIQAFYNVCPHRGRRLKTSRKGNVATGIACPFHAWRFDMDGKVKHIPNPEGWEGCATLEPDRLSLTPVRTDRFAGWVWLTMAEDAPPLLDHIEAAAPSLDAFAIDAARMVFYKTLHVPADWKIVLEAFIEGYHSHGTHPQMARYGDLSWAGDVEQGLATTHATRVLKTPDNMEPRERFYRLITELSETLHAMFFEPGLAAAARVRDLPAGTSEEEVFDRYWAFHREELEQRGVAFPPKLKPEHLHNTVWHIFPNTSVLPTVDGALWYRFRPDPDRKDGSLLDVWALGRFAPGREPKVDQEVFLSLEAFKGQNPFLEQDFGNLLAVAKGTRSRAWQGANINPREETTVFHFHRNMRRYLDRTE